MIFGPPIAPAVSQRERFDNDWSLPTLATAIGKAVHVNKVVLQITAFSLRAEFAS